MIQDITGESKAKIEVVVRGYLNSIKKEDAKDGMSIRGKLILLIPQIAKQYGARYDLAPEVVRECCKLILTKFSHISIDEIQEAYREWIAGELDVKGAEMYGGEFNVAQLGKILAAYSDRRKKIVAEWIKNRDNLLQQERIEKRKNLQKERFEKEFPIILKKAQAEFTDWRQVKEFWYKSLLDRNWIRIDKKEALEIYDDALELAAIEHQSRVEETRMKGVSEILRSNILSKEELAKVIARKLTVFRKVIQDKSWEPGA